MLWTRSAMLLFLGALAATTAVETRADPPPRYDSADNVNRPRSWGAATPEDDGRPGEKYYFLGVQAIKHNDYKFAIDMYEVSASWAYKPAQYNLAIMYLKGDGVPIDRPRAMAWAALAAERNDNDYVEARELIYAKLTPEEFAHANEIWRTLKPTYGDEIALARAKTRWSQVRAAMTGSHVGSVGNLKIGAASSAVKPVAMAGIKSAVNGFATAAFGVLGGSSEDGAIAYRQLRESDDPYDPKFEWRTSPIPIGTATVGPLKPVDANSGSDDKAEPSGHNLY